MTLFGGIETALSGLRAQQVLVETSTQNVTNSDNPDYSRQVVDLAANPAYPAPGFAGVGPGQIGTGVNVAAVRRVSDPFTTTQLQAALAQQGSDNVEQDTTSQIEGIFNELSGNGISSLMGKFWSAWQEVSNSPTDPGVRANLVAQAQSLTTTIQQTASQLQTLRQNLNGLVGQQVSTLNTLTSQIAGLNKQIASVQATGQQPNDLLDQRDALLQQVSQIAQVQVNPLANGAVRVVLAGVPLVDGNTAFTLTTTANANGVDDITAPDGTVITPTSGSLAGLEAMRDQEIVNRLNDLNTWTGRLITAVNAAHSGTDPSTGATVTNVYDLVTPGTPVQRPFFVGTDATNIAVSPSIVQNPSLIAASQTANGPGDGSNALVVANLQSDPQAGGAPAGSPTIDGQYQELATDIGSAAATAKSRADDQQLLVTHLQQRRAQLSGVSLDEEAAHLVSYQRAYEASARALTVFDDMLDKLINDTGIVGR
jgi:flagellar hook-associated protein 1 FlgK